MALLIFIAMVGAFIIGNICMMCAVIMISPTAYRILSEELGRREAERKTKQDKEGMEE